jgi:membrane protein YqaA with SNARE-associated domain
MRRFIDWVMGFAEMLGGPGLFLLAFLDSSFLSLPEVVDILMVGLVAKYPERLVWYASMPTLGSIAGSYVIYALARRGGEAFLRRRLHERHVERAFAVIRKYGLLAVAIPSILPPPMPFKIFVLAAGAAGVKRIDFLIAISIGRGARFFLEALLAAWYGEAALGLIGRHATPISIAVAVAVLVGAGVWVLWRRRR